MKYLVVYNGNVGEEKTLCSEEKSAIELVESKLREGCAETDLQVYTAEPISFFVKREPVVTLNEETPVAAAAHDDSAEPAKMDYPASAFSSYTSDEKNEEVNPFSTEQVFSLDS